MTRRPLGITILAVLHYVAAGWCAFVATVALVSADAMVELDRSMNPLVNYVEPQYTFKFRVVRALLALGTMLFFYFAGGGLWQLRNWARIVTVSLCVLVLIIGGPPSEIVWRVLSVLVLLYLVSQHVKSAFADVHSA